jgi:hypothetical protein
MKDIKSYLIVILLIVIAILVMNKCNRTSTSIPEIDTVETISYIHDTIKLNGKTKIKPIPEIQWIHDTIIDSTGKVSITNIKKYTTNDTFVYKTDSFAVTFYSKIYSECPLDSLNHDLVASIRYKVIERTITNEIVRNKSFFIGPSVGLNKSSSYISLDGLYERQGKQIYKIGVGVNTRLEPVIKAGVYWQIRK